MQINDIKSVHESVFAGLSFGLTSGVITTLGLLVGLAAGTESRLAVIGGVITISLADAMSDALGVHISEESRSDYSKSSLWAATLVTFFSKAVVSLTFLAPILTLALDMAVKVSVVWGLSLVCLLSAWIAKRNGESMINAVAEHMLIAVIVIVATHVLGLWVGRTFS